MIEVTWLLFVVASLVLIVTPGQDMILVMSRSIAQGAGAGVATAAGVSTGLVGHTLLATLGLGAILRTSEWLFLVLKLAGAAYLVYLAVMAWRAPAALELETRLVSNRGGALRYFYQGLTNNLVNPKMIPFFIALFPQFVHPELGAVAL